MNRLAVIGIFIVLGASLALKGLEIFESDAGMEDEAHDVRDVVVGDQQSFEAEEHFRIRDGDGEGDALIALAGDRGDCSRRGTIVMGVSGADRDQQQSKTCHH